MSRGAFPTFPPNILRSMKVVTTHLGYKRKYKLHRVLGTHAANTFFDCEEFNTKRMSVKDYFKRKYNITLRHATDLPVLDVGSRAKPSYLPAEICEIDPGNAYRGKLGDRETAAMIGVAKNQPRVTAELITGPGFESLALIPGSNDTLTNFGVEITPSMVDIPGRELPAPSLSYRGQTPQRPQVLHVKEGTGSWNIMDVKFQKPGQAINSWWVLVVRDGGPEPNMGVIKDLATAFAQKLRKSGMTIAEFGTKPPRLIQVGLPNPAEDTAGRQRALGTIEDKMVAQLRADNGAKPAFVLVVLFRRDNFIYPGIKVRFSFNLFG